MGIFYNLAKVFVILVFLCLILFSCDEKPTYYSIDKNSISGTLVDEQGNPVAAAVIDVLKTAGAAEVSTTKDTTDENGKFLLEKLPTDLSNFSIKITHPDFKLYTEALSAFKSKSNSPVILLHADTCNGTVNISTYKKSDSTELSDVEVRMFRNGSQIRKDTSVNGKVTFEFVCPGVYIVRIYKAGFGLIYDSVRVYSGDTVNRKFYLADSYTDTCCNGILKVFLKDKKTGNAAGHAPTVSLYKNGQLLSTYNCTGNYVYFSKLCAGNYHVKITSYYYDSLSWDYTSNCNSFDTITKFLNPTQNSDSCCNGKIVVTVKDSASGDLIYGAYVGLSKNGTTLTSSNTVNGVVTFTGLCPGDYSLYYYKTGSTRVDAASWTVTLNCNDSAGFVKRLVSQDACCRGQITVNVKDSTTGDPLDSVYVSLSQNGKSIKSGQTRNGTITFTGLCAGTYSVYYSGKQGWYRAESMNWNVTLDCNDTVSYTRTMIQLSLCCNGTISGTVADSTSGNSLSGVSVTVYSGSTKIGTITTDSNGRFEFTGICPAQHSLSFYLSGYNGKSIYSINAGCNDTSNNFSVKLLKK